MKRLLLSVLMGFAFIGCVAAQTSLVLPNNEVPLKELAYKVVNNEVRTEMHVSFAKGTAELLPGSEQELLTIKKYLEERSYISMLRVEGHTSCGNGAQELSEARAMAVVDWLVAHGVDCKRLLPVGFGCTKPIMDMHNEQNARITFMNAALKGRAIGGMPVDGGAKVAGDACHE